MKEVLGWKDLERVVEDGRPTMWGGAEAHDMRPKGYGLVIGVERAMSETSLHQLKTTLQL